LRNMPAQHQVRRIRDAIDETDDAILRLIQQRLGLAKEMADAKQERASRSPLRPLREVAILERLKNQAGSAEATLIEIVWRELIGHGRQAQGRMELLLFTHGDAALLEECARRHFGTAIEVEWADSADAALQATSLAPVIAVVDSMTDNPKLNYLGEIKTLGGVRLGSCYAGMTAED
jgi:chorismate mutase